MFGLEGGAHAFHGLRFESLAFAGLRVYELRSKKYR